MKPRRPFTLLAAFSALLLLATIALWLRGRHVRDGLWYTTDSTRYSIHSYRGRVWFWTLSAKPSPSAIVWTTPARMDKGYVIDSVHDRWYDQFTATGRGPRLPDDFLNCPTQGSPAAPRHFLGFRYVRNDTWWPLAQLPFNYPKAESTALYVPHWSLALLCALLPTAWLLRTHRARSSHHRGLCPTCAYDLRATPNQCPECGAKSDARAAATTAQPLPR